MKKYLVGILMILFSITILHAQNWTGEDFNLDSANNPIKEKKSKLVHHNDDIIYNSSFGLGIGYIKSIALEVNVSYKVFGLFLTVSPGDNISYDLDSPAHSDYSDPVLRKGPLLSYGIRILPLYSKCVTPILGLGLTNRTYYWISSSNVTDLTALNKKENKSEWIIGELGLKINISNVSGLSLLFPYFIKNNDRFVTFFIGYNRNF